MPSHHPPLSRDGERTKCCYAGEGGCRMETPESPLVPLLYPAAQILGRRGGLEGLLPEILSVAIDAVPARRGVIVTRFRDGGPPEVGASVFRGEGSGHLPLNEALIDSVLEGGTAILTADGPGARGGTAAAMCAPLCGRDRTLGAIYVDSGAEAPAFVPEHLQLLTAIGHVAGMAVENELRDQQRLAQERLAAIGEAVAGITHYMRNILTGIKGGLELMAQAQGKADWQQIAFGLDIAHVSLRRFESLVVDLLAYAGKGDLARGPVCVNGLVREVLKAVQARAERFQVVLTFREGFVAETDLDGNQIHRVLLNLVQNAIDACEQHGGAVEVSTDQNAAETVIRVRDTGIGIPPENLPKLSQAFFTTKSGRGTGLGLACSYRAVKQHGGRVTVESEPGKGATFTVTLPREAKDAGAPAAAPS